MKHIGAGAVGAKSVREPRIPSTPVSKFTMGTKPDEREPYPHTEKNKRKGVFFKILDNPIPPATGGRATSLTQVAWVSKAIDNLTVMSTDKTFKREMLDR